MSYPCEDEEFFLTPSLCLKIQQYIQASAKHLTLSSRCCGLGSYIYAITVPVVWWLYLQHYSIPHESQMSPFLLR